MKSYGLSSFLCGIVSLSFLWTCANSRHTRFTCEGARLEGDKWFDGCRWCVCQLDGPLCSPASCSDLVAQVPPCENLGSRWRDGCYQCQCNVDGIECQADRSCVILMQREEYQRQILSPGACVEPEDDRCVCGVDGVPSCTAEVIDRNAHPATTIALDFSTRPTKVTTSSYGSSLYKNEKSKHRVKRRSTNNDYLSNSRYLLRSLYNYRKSKRYRARSSYQKPYRFYNPVGGYYNYADLQAGYPNKGYHVPRKSSTKRYHHNRKLANYLAREQRTYRNEPDVDYKNGILNDESVGLKTPRSLLIITNNRCRYGVRWYGGGLRCYCNEDGSITCGDPRFVATRIDGFRLKNALCEEGHAWHDESSCQVCECKINGVVLCRRSETCPLPFLIQPVKNLSNSEEEDEEEEDEEEEDLEQRSKEFPSKDEVANTPSYSNSLDRRSGLKSYSRLFDKGYLHGRRPQDDEDQSGSVESDGSGDDKSIELSFEVTRKPPLVIDNTKYNKHKSTGTQKGNKKHTTVIVTECNPGSRWLEGCKRCSCDSRGRKYCSDRLCPKPAMAPFKYELWKQDHVVDRDRGRPFQRPPTILPFVRDKPVNTKPPFPSEKPCGRFKVGARYLIKCNRCLCTSHGPKCTAINCG